MLKNKNIIIVIGAVIFAVAAGAFFFRGEEIIDVSVLELDEAEITRLGNDIEILFEENVILDEINQTFIDISDDGSGISVNDALNLDLINGEASQADLSVSFDAFTADEAILTELDQSFGEVSR